MKRRASSSSQQQYSPNDGGTMGDGAAKGKKRTPRAGLGRSDDRLLTRGESAPLDADGRAHASLNGTALRSGSKASSAISASNLNHTSMGAVPLGASTNSYHTTNKLYSASQSLMASRRPPHGGESSRQSAGWGARLQGPSSIQAIAMSTKRPKDQPFAECDPPGAVDGPASPGLPLYGVPGNAASQAAGQASQVSPSSAFSVGQPISSGGSSGPPQWMTSTSSPMLSPHLVPEDPLGMKQQRASLSGSLRPTPPCLSKPSNAAAGQQQFSQRTGGRHSGRASFQAGSETLLDSGLGRLGAGSSESVPWDRPDVLSVSAPVANQRCSDGLNAHRGDQAFTSKGGRAATRQRRSVENCNDDELIGSRLLHSTPIISSAGRYSADAGGDNPARCPSLSLSSAPRFLSGDCAGTPTMNRSSFTSTMSGQPLINGRRRSSTGREKGLRDDDGGWLGGNSAAVPNALTHSSEQGFGGAPSDLLTLPMTMRSTGQPAAVTTSPALSGASFAGDRVASDAASEWSLSSIFCPNGAGQRRTSVDRSSRRASTSPCPYEFHVLSSTGKTSLLPIQLTCAVGSEQGMRPTMEDDHFVCLNQSSRVVEDRSGGNAQGSSPTSGGGVKSGLSIVGILDGHCGKRVADLGQRFIPECFLSHPAVGENNALALVEAVVLADEQIYQTLAHRCSTSSSSLRGRASKPTTAVGRAGKGRLGTPASQAKKRFIGDGFAGSGSFSSSRDMDGGSTLICAVVDGRMLYVAGLGDARAVLYDGTTTVAMSDDHKPSNVKEAQRIRRCGGMVQFGRVCGVLAVSRALGDYEFKTLPSTTSTASTSALRGSALSVGSAGGGRRMSGPRGSATATSSSSASVVRSGSAAVKPQLVEFMVSNVADVRQVNLTDESKFLLLACDGLWDVLSNDEATQFVVDFLTYTPELTSAAAVRRALDMCCVKLAQYAIERGSMDNVSVMLLFFHDVPTVIAGFKRRRCGHSIEGAGLGRLMASVGRESSCERRGVGAVGGVESPSCTASSSAPALFPAPIRTSQPPARAAAINSTGLAAGDQRDSNINATNRFSMSWKPSQLTSSSAYGSGLFKAPSMKDYGLGTSSRRR